MNSDFILFQKLNGFAGKSVCLDSVFIFFAEYLEYFLIAALFLFLAKNFKKYLPMAVAGIFAALFSRFIIAEAIRFFWYRPRPFLENDVNLLFNHAATGSFPSGHAAFYFGLSTVVYLYNKKAGVLFFIAGFLISVSRVVAGVHWPTDVLAGAIIGIVAGLAVNFLFRKRAAGRPLLSRFFLL